MTLLRVIPRAAWGARHPNGFGPAPVPYSRTYLHQSVTIAPDLVWVDADGDGVDDDEERAMRLLEDIGQQRFGGGISYTWPIFPSGRIYEGHSVDRQGAHTGGLNDVARAIVFVGRYQTTAPTAAQLRSAAWLLQHNRDKKWTKTAAITGGHRDVKATECPGDLAYAAIPEINRLAAGPAIKEDDDMATPQEIAAAVWAHLLPSLDNGKLYPAAAFVTTDNRNTWRLHRAILDEGGNPKPVMTDQDPAVLTEAMRPLVPQIAEDILAGLPAAIARDVANELLRKIGSIVTADEVARGSAA